MYDSSVANGKTVGVEVYFSEYLFNFFSRLDQLIAVISGLFRGKRGTHNLCRVETKLPPNWSRVNVRECLNSRLYRGQAGKRERNMTQTLYANAGLLRGVLSRCGEVPLSVHPLVAAHCSAPRRVRQASRPRCTYRDDRSASVSYTRGRGSKSEAISRRSLPFIILTPSRLTSLSQPRRQPAGKLRGKRILFRRDLPRTLHGYVSPFVPRILVEINGQLICTVDTRSAPIGGDPPFGKPRAHFDNSRHRDGTDNRRNSRKCRG